MKKRITKKTSKKVEIRQEKNSLIDGWGLILLIIGISLFLLKEEIRIIGGFVALIGLIRIIYVLIKYRQ